MPSHGAPARARASVPAVTSKPHPALRRGRANRRAFAPASPPSPCWAGGRERDRAFPRPPCARPPASAASSWTASRSVSGSPGVADGASWRATSGRESGDAATREHRLPAARASPAGDDAPAHAAPRRGRRAAGRRRARARRSAARSSSRCAPRRNRSARSSASTSAGATSRTRTSTGSRSRPRNVAFALDYALLYQEIERRALEESAARHHARSRLAVRPRGSDRGDLQSRCARSWTTTRPRSTSFSAAPACSRW